MNKEDIKFYIGGVVDDIDKLHLRETESKLMSELGVDVHESCFAEHPTDGDELSKFLNNTKELLTSHAAFFDLTDPVDKDMIELGQISGINHMVNLILELSKDALKHSDKIDPRLLLGFHVLELIKQVPIKKTYIHGDSSEFIACSSDHTYGLIEHNAEVMEFGDALEDSKEMIKHIIDSHKNGGVDDE